MVTLGADVAKAYEAVEIGPPVVTGMKRGGGLQPPPPLAGGVTDGCPVLPLPLPPPPPLSPGEEVTDGCLVPPLPVPPPPPPPPPPGRTGGAVGQFSAVGCVV